MVNQINISYNTINILPHKKSVFSEYINKSVQNFRFKYYKMIPHQVFLGSFVCNIENHIKLQPAISIQKISLIYAKSFVSLIFKCISTKIKLFFLFD